MKLPPLPPELASLGPEIYPGDLPCLGPWYRVADIPRQLTALAKSVRETIDG